MRRTGRFNALWGSSGRGGGSRSNALWGKGGRGLATALVLGLAFALQLATAPGASAARMPKSLRDAITAKPGAAYKVILLGTRRTSTASVASKVKNAQSAYPASVKGIKKKHSAVNAVSAELSGRQLSELDRDGGITAITRDTRVRSAAYRNDQEWPRVHDAPEFWSAAESSGLIAPTIAVVDSGVDAARSDFGGRVVARVNFTTLTPNSSGDGRGHGTFVASIAAGAAPGYSGFVPNANLVSLDVLADSGEGLMSDVIAAADWIYLNKDRYGIRVANFSLTGSVDSSFMYDPLCKAVEKLWLSGVVVVAASGNYATDGLASGVRYAPANDPFVITAGAADTDGSTGTRDDFNAPWSAYGYTPDGFAKPDVGAAGRYMNGAVPTSSTMYAERPDRIVAPGYMWMSGTSFAAPVVAGAAAHVLALKPSWTPDQVKGALMLSARALTLADPRSLGVGEVQAGDAGRVSTPPNPNLALNGYLAPDPNGGTTPVFDAAAWSSAAKADAYWDAAAWSSAAWSSAAWSSAAWSSAAWSSAAWSSAAWSSGTLSDGTQASAAWASSIWVE